jgi:hypothetical protein
VGISNTLMTHRERVLTAINHQEPDRVPLDLWGVETILEERGKAHISRDTLVQKGVIFSKTDGGDTLWYVSLTPF